MGGARSGQQARGCGLLAKGKGQPVEADPVDVWHVGESGEQLLLPEGVAQLHEGDAYVVSRRCSVTREGESDPRDARHLPGRIEVRDGWAAHVCLVK